MPGNQCDCCKVWQKKGIYVSVLTLKLYRYLEILKNVIYTVVASCALYADHLSLCIKIMHFVCFGLEILLFLPASVVSIRDRASTSTVDDTINKKPNIRLSIPRYHNSNTRCIICKRQTCPETVAKAD